MDRRTFLSLATTGASGLLAAAVAIPVVAQLLTPLLSRTRAASGWLRLGPLADFPVGPPRRVGLPVTARDGWTERTDVQTVWVLRPQEDAIQVLTAICPHLGCSVRWKAARGAFACPCHDSEFAPDGARRHGPARRGMDPLPVRITHGEVQVRWVEFVAGAAERRTTDGSPVDGQGTA